MEPLGLHAVTERPVAGRWFEELTPGLVVDHAIRRTITEADNVLFSAVTMNPAALHLDFEYAAETEFGQPLVNSMFTLALVIGLSIHELTFGTTVANLGFDAVEFPAPVFHGDTIRVQTEVCDARPSSTRPTQGIVTLEHRAYKQGDFLVCRAVRKALMHKRPG
jgi:acyl dehydratase